MQPSTAVCLLGRLNVVVHAAHSSFRLQLASGDTGDERWIRVDSHGDDDLNDIECATEPSALTTPSEALSRSVVGAERDFAKTPGSVSSSEDAVVANIPEINVNELPVCPEQRTSMFRRMYDAGLRVRLRCQRWPRLFFVLRTVFLVALYVFTWAQMNHLMNTREGLM